MKKFNELISLPPLSEGEDSVRRELLTRGKKVTVHDMKKKVEEHVENLVEFETTSIIDILQGLKAETFGRVVAVEESTDSTKEFYIDFETAQTLLTVYESLDGSEQLKFEQMLLDNLDTLDEIAVYCEDVINLTKE